MKLGMGDVKGAEQALEDRRLLMCDDISGRSGKLFRLQRECTDLYLRMHKTKGYRRDCRRI